MINTNLIIGRLGSGKTTCIRNLIENIPENEYWVIIVNEFGQIGLDSALLSGFNDNNLCVTEINGGCICCAAQSQLRVTLTNLIRKHKPDRIIIEATGLGHPAGIIDLLRSEFLRPLINISSIITVVDISLFRQSYNPLDTRSPLTTESFSQQTQLADIIILNKMDLAEPTDLGHATDYLKTIYPQKLKILPAEHGEFDIKYLSFDSSIGSKSIPDTLTSTDYSSQSQTNTYHDAIIKSFSSESDECISVGFIFPSSLVFNRKKLQDLFEKLFSDADLQLIRLKAVFNCGRFWQAFNAIESHISAVESYYRRDSRIELISNNKSFDVTIFKESLFLCLQENH